MPLIHWREGYAVNVFKLDQEHKKLVELINRLFEARRNGEDDQVLREIMTELSDYTQIHFTHEEQEMERLNYSDLEFHKEQHRKLRQQVIDLKTMIDQDIEGLASLIDFSSLVTECLPELWILELVTQPNSVIKRRIVFHGKLHCCK